MDGNKTKFTSINQVSLALSFGCNSRCVYSSVKIEVKELMLSSENLGNILRKLGLALHTMVKNRNPPFFRHQKKKETCAICLEKTDSDHMFSLHDCAHKRCISCLKNHFKAKLQEGCKSPIQMRSCRKVLRSEMVKTVEQRLKESKVPFWDRVYCPYPKCSNLMPRAEVLRYSKRSQKNAEETNYRKCLKCYGKFCVKCKVFPWHEKMTCGDYKKAHPYSGEEMVVSLAKSHAWRQCVKCSHMIELSAGCYHMTCRCGYQFCYTCGSEWKEVRKPCACPMWNERLIVYRN